MVRLQRAGACATLVVAGLASMLGCGDGAETSRTPDGGAAAAGGGTGATGPQGGSGAHRPLTCPADEEPTGFFVAPDASAAGDGSLAAPWDLATALAAPPEVVAGSTIWLRGGVYPGSYVSTLTGTAEAPIVVRSYPGELAIIDGAGSSEVTLTLNGAYAWFWGLEITNSSGNHTYGDRPNGLDTNGKFLKLINCYVHDSAGNFMYSSLTEPDIDCEGLELYGSLFYLQGVNPEYDGDRAHGHAIYAQNFQGKKRLRENLIFNGFSWGIHAYAENPDKYVIDGFDFIGNVTFNTNSAKSGPIAGGNDLLVGGDSGVYAAHILLEDNFSWAHGPSYSVKLGYGETHNHDVDIRNNHFAGGFQLGLWDAVTMSGNTIWGDYDGLDAASHPDNDFVAEPTGVEVFVRPNEHEPGRGHVIVYDWDDADSATADLSTVLPLGANYEIRNAQDPLGEPVLTGTYDGNPVTLPLDGLHPQQPVGLPDAILPDEETGRAFNVFLVLGC